MFFRHDSPSKSTVSGLTISFQIFLNFPSFYNNQNLQNFKQQNVRSIFWNFSIFPRTFSAGWRLSLGCIRVGINWGSAVYSPHLVRDSDCALCRVRSSLFHLAASINTIFWMFYNLLILENLIWPPGEVAEVLFSSFCFKKTI